MCVRPVILDCTIHSFKFHIDVDVDLKIHLVIGQNCLVDALIY